MVDKESRRQLIASRIREARKMAGLSQAQVAKLLNLHRPSITEAEAGNRRVTAEEIAQLADLYDVDVAWLLGEGEEKADPQDDKLQLAARELEKLDPEGLNRILRLLAARRDKGDAP